MKKRKCNVVAISGPDSELHPRCERRFDHSAVRPRVLPESARLHEIVIHIARKRIRCESFEANLKTRLARKTHLPNYLHRPMDCFVGPPRFELETSCIVNHVVISRKLRLEIWAENLKENPVVRTSKVLDSILHVVG